MDNVLIFIISIGIAGLLFTAFSEMVKRSAKAHREEEMRLRQQEARMMARQNAHNNRPDDNVTWTSTGSFTAGNNDTPPKSTIEEYIEE